LISHDHAILLREKTLSGIKIGQYFSTHAIHSAHDRVKHISWRSGNK
jgi:hypothetical protein